MRDPRERFLEKVQPQPNGCWLWTAKITPNGYGQFSVGGRTDGSRALVYAHRWAYQEFVRDIPAGLTIDHLCGTTACVQPEHLEAVTLAENIRRSENAKRKIQSCPSGHAYTGDNLYLAPSGGRKCRQCHARQQRERYRETRGTSNR